MGKEYSVLMSVYEKENPSYFRAAMLSMLRQSVPPSEIVLVCDGPVTDSLEAVITEFDTGFSGQLGDVHYDKTDNVFKVVRLPENEGLGRALSEGLKLCSSELIARMDSDDISSPERCEKQLKYIIDHPETDVLSGTIAEFTGDALTVEEAGQQVVSLKKVPGTNEGVRNYIKTRNPINHPCVMFKRSAVLKAGGYQECPYFEDYDLWARMMKNGAVFANLSDTLLYMRVNDMSAHRGGISYAKSAVAFEERLHEYGIINSFQMFTGCLTRGIVSLFPDSIRQKFYKLILR